MRDNFRARPVVGRSRSLAHRRFGVAPRAPRVGFTLVEVLMVILIISMLVALLLPAIGAARNAAIRAAIKIDVSELASAMEKFKTQYGGYPPDRNWTDAEIEQFLRKAFPRRSLTIYQNVRDTIKNRNEAETLVMWLGGRWDGAHMTGFNADPTGDPFAAGGQRTTPILSFAETRLQDRENNGWPEYYPPNINLQQAVPYVYFAARPNGKYWNVNSGSAVRPQYVCTLLSGQTTTAVPYHFKQIDPNNTSQSFWMNPTSFQIICAGIDNEYGAVADKVFPTGANYNISDNDNIVSFSEKTSETLSHDYFANHSKERRDAGRRWAFTLVELLVVMVIIALLSAMVLGALASTYETAKLAKTKATIAKIHNQLAHRWDSYRTRRLPLIKSQNDTQQVFAAKRLVALWDLMRIEMPDDYSDLTFPPLSQPPGLFDATYTPVQQSLDSNALRQAYLYVLKSSYNIDPATVDPNRPNASAECLYLTVTVGMNADEEIRFLDNEIGRPDPKGPPVFIDGWGRPIRWMRWAPGYVPNTGPKPPGPPSADSDFQRADPPGSAALTSGSATPLSFQPDPFDPRGICRPGGLMQPPGTKPQFWDGTAQADSWGFKLMPLVVSAGPDGEFGLRGLRQLESAQFNDYDQNAAWHPYALHNGQWRGTPAAGLEGGGHLDNITNHRLGNR